MPPPITTTSLRLAPALIAAIVDSPPVAFPLKPPIQPQLALSRKVLPEGEEWAYEPKYDGFRAIAFVGGARSSLQSRGAKPLLRYFPELVLPEGRYVIDGELVILDDDGRRCSTRSRPVFTPPSPA